MARPLRATGAAAALALCVGLGCLRALGGIGGIGDIGESRIKGRDPAALAGQRGEELARLRNPVLRARWQRWFDETVAESRAGAGRAVVIDKLALRCLLIAGGHTVASYPAELGRNGLAMKLYAGDRATPEGRYHVIEKRDLGETSFHRALLLDYPTAEDRRSFEESRRQGRVPAGRGIGGLIEIHGHGGRLINWTDGCVALRDAHIDELFAMVEVGAPVTIVGACRAPGRGAPAVRGGGR